MRTLADRRRLPFLWGVGILAIVSLAVARLPESFVEGLQDDSPFSLQQSTWIFRFFAAAALIQALYGGFRQFRLDRIRNALETDEAAAAWPSERLVSTIARNAVVASLMPLVYGLVLLGLTGLRGNYWLFALLSLAQLAWYYRLAGELERWATDRRTPLESP
jgi:hypothetical protein